MKASLYSKDSTETKQKAKVSNESIYKKQLKNLSYHKLLWMSQIVKARVEADCPEALYCSVK